VTADHVLEVHGVWCVAVERPGAVHHVPILLAQVPAVLELVERYPVGPLIHEDAHRKEVGEMLQKFRRGPCTPQPNTWRYRSTWLLSHLALGTRIDLIVEAAGVRDQRGITELMRHLPQLDPAVAMQMLAGGAE